MTGTSTSTPTTVARAAPAPLPDWARTVWVYVLAGGIVLLAVAGVLFSAVSAYFYLRIIMQMYMYEPKEEFSLVRSPALALALAISVSTSLARFA